MKNRDIEKQLARDNVPDIYDKILVSAQAEGLMPAEAEVKQKKAASPAQTKTRRTFFASLSAAVMAVAVCLAIVLPLTLGGGVTNAPVSLSVNDVYAIGAVASVRLLGDDAAVKKAGALAATADYSYESTDNQTEAKNQIKKFDEYFSALDSFFGEDIVTTVATENTDENYSQYKVKLAITGTDPSGAAVNYVMYYNETRDNRHGHDDDDEERYTMEGVMLVNGIEHYLEGERKVETERDESETELKIRAYADPSDRLNYIQMEQETSVERNETETEYVFGVYKNGKLVEQTAVEFETERKGGKEETEYSLEFRQGDTKGKYQIERETKNGVSKIKVKYDINGDKGEFTVNGTTGKYSYTFSDGTTLTI